MAEIGQSIEIIPVLVKDILVKKLKMNVEIKKFRELLDMRGFLIYNDLV